MSKRYYSFRYVRATRCLSLTVPLVVISTVWVLTTWLGWANRGHACALRCLPASFSLTLGGKRAIDGVLALYSIALHHPRAHVYIATDTHTYRWYINYAGFLKRQIYLHWDLAMDKYNTTMTRKEMEDAGVWQNFMLEKVAIMRRALNNHNNTIVLDADVVLMGPVRIPQNPAALQLGVSPHYMKASEEDKFGLYNGGMVWTNQKSACDAWIDATAKSKYYEQAAIEDLTKRYTYFEFGPEHNLGYWRVAHGNGRIFYRHLKFDAQSGKMFVGKLPVASIHSHLLTPYPYPVANEFSNRLLSIIRQSNDSTYKKLDAIIRWANDTKFPSSQV